MARRPLPSMAHHEGWVGSRGSAPPNAPVQEASRPLHHYTTTHDHVSIEQPVPAVAVFSSRPPASPPWGWPQRQAEQSARQPFAPSATPSIACLYQEPLRDTPSPAHSYYPHSPQYYPPAHAGGATPWESAPHGVHRFKPPIESRRPVAALSPTSYGGGVNARGAYIQQSPPMQQLPPRPALAARRPHAHLSGRSLLAPRLLGQSAMGIERPGPGGHSERGVTNGREHVGGGGA